MTLAHKRRRRVETLIDQRLVGFLKPMMSLSTGPNRVDPKPKLKVKPISDLNHHRETKRGDRAS